MRNIVLPIAAVVFFAAIVGGFFVSSLGPKDDDDTPSASLARPSQGGMTVYPVISTDGTHVSVNGEQVMTVQTEKQKSLKVEDFKLDQQTDVDTLTLSVGGSKFVHKAYSISYVVWSDAAESYFFVEEDKPKSENDPQEGKVWQWNRDKGFRAVSTTRRDLDDLTFPPDGKTAAVQIQEAEAGSPFGASSGQPKYLLLDVASGKEKTFTYEDFADNCVPLSMDEVLIDGHNELGNQTYRWNLKRNKLEPLVPDASLVGAASLGGTIFGLHKVDRQYEVIEFKPGLKTWKPGYRLPNRIVDSSLDED